MWKVVSLRKAVRYGKAIGGILCLLLVIWTADRLWRSEPVAVTALAQYDPLPQSNEALYIDLSQAVLPEGTKEPSAPAELTVEVVHTEPEQAPKRILIYHTHTYEAYKQQPGNLYKETETWRTKDAQHNVVRVGDELTRLLRAKGYQVIHDTTAYEPPQLSSAYTRSLKMLEERAQKGEVYDLYIDLHRDAYNQSLANRNTVQVGDQSLARVMVLIGKGSGQTYTEKPDWERNYASAQMLTENLNQQVEGLCRNISLKSGRFNQHVGECCLLIEAGNNENTLEEVLAAMPYLADGIRSMLSAHP